jgi:hypothetical protein
MLQLNLTYVPRAASFVAKHLVVQQESHQSVVAKLLRRPAIQPPPAALQGCDSVAGYDSVLQRVAARSQHICLVRI